MTPLLTGISLSRVSFETSFDSKQPKLEPKLVSALSETKRLFRFYTETESFDVSIEPKQTEDQPKKFDREHILVFLWKVTVVSVCFGWFRNSSDCFNCFDIGSKHRKQTKNFDLIWVSRNKPKQILFRFVSVRTEIFVCLFRGHPIPEDGACGSAPLSVHVDSASGSRAGQNNTGAASTYCACSVLPTLFKIFSAGLRLKNLAVVRRVPTPTPPSSTRGKAGRNYLNEEIATLLPTGIGERFRQILSNLGHAALLRRCELPL